MATSSTRIGDGASDTGASRLRRQQVSGRRRIASAVVAACLVTAALAVPGSSPAFAGESGAGRVEVLSPRPGALVWNASKQAAARTKVHALIRVTGGPVASLSVRLNGHPLRGMAAPSGKLRVLLSKMNGLTIGHNVLFVSVTLAGSDHPLQVARRFVVGYKTKQHLISWSGVRRGAGSAPAALLTARAPLTRVARITAWLNGPRLSLPGARIGRHRHRVLGLNLAQLGRLRFGRNHVRVRVVMNDGRFQVLRQRFTLDRHRDIAVARQVGKAVVGRTLSLDASRSRLAGGRLHAHWFLVRKPELSHARLGAATGTTSSLRPDVPGTYLIGLRTRAGAGAGYDVLAASATYPEPLVPVDTAATQNGQSGLQVGDQFYGYNSDAIQVIQLDAYTLQATHYNTYQATSQSLGQMKSDLSTASPDALVFIAAPDGRPDLPVDQVSNLAAALGEVGGNLGAYWGFGNPDCWSGDNEECVTGDSNYWTKVRTDTGPFTMVGVAGMPAGQAWRETASQTSAGGGAASGGIKGYLTPGVASSGGLSDTYTLIPGPVPYEPVATCVNVGDAACAVTVAGQTIPSPNANGIHVVVLNRTTLAVQTNQTVTTYADLETALNVMLSEPPLTINSVVKCMGCYDGQSDQSLVIVQSVGNGMLTGSPSTALYQYIDELGGTPESLQGSLTGGHPYALVGVANNLPWYGTSGLESSTVMATSDDPGQPNGQITGMLERDRTGLFTPVSGSPAGPINSDLYGIVFQPAQDWPYAGDPALPYIADNIELSAYPDVRSGYYLNLQINWDTETSALTKLTCTDPNSCGPNFNAVKAQLLQEFAWVSTVKSFITNNLLSPYEENGAGAIFAVDSIYDNIKNSLPPPPPVKTGLNWLNTISSAVGILNDLGVPYSGDAAAALSTATMGTTIADSFVAAPGGGTADTVTADAPDQLSAQLADQQTAAVLAINRLEPILLYDYGKLSAVGTAAGGQDPSWDWTNDSIIDTINALNASTSGATYTSLIPEIYQATSLQPNPNAASTYGSTNDVTAYQCSEDDHPFAAALSQNQFHAVSRFYSGTTQSDAWTFGNDVSSSSPQMPTTSLTGAIYGPDAKGADGADQYAPDWWRTTYNPPGGVQCDPPHDGTSWTAPSIPLPPP